MKLGRDSNKQNTFFRVDASSRSISHFDRELTNYLFSQILIYDLLSNHTDYTS